MMANIDAQLTLNQSQSLFFNVTDVRYTPPVEPEGFVLKPYHKAFIVSTIGTLDLSDYVTALSGRINATEVYLQFTLAGNEFIDDLIANQNQLLSFDVAYKNTITNEFEQIETIASALVEAVAPQIGGRSVSVNLTARDAYTPPTAKTVAIKNIEYLTNSQIRLAIDYSINVGDTVTHDYGQMTIGEISYTLGQYSKLMTLTSA